ncbi:ferritin-like domain-containing protein [Roseibacterium sp. SDUM158017]|uniref:ferritin-like domain-containing protein n=1 Tax=Roseicyclus salinarum TaxID=3036773 RepID=UPI002415644B|nr:ferritin-like domain-containing protein [Roseibacterium sp. SDUM158017]MDG4647312.1 ferritin-like domain-containing protein [Roseibacterium sp. SDUM158017]
MATLKGGERDARTLLEHLIRLEHDAIAAFDVAIERLQDKARARMVRAFRDDHMRHLEELARLAAAHRARDPGKGSMKSLLATGKVRMASLTGGDAAILEAMSANETDTVTAYLKASRNPHAPEDARPFLDQALADEERHKAWLDTEAETA